MDVETQASRNEDDFSLKGMKKIMQDKAKHPTVSATLIVFLILNLIMLVVGSMHTKDCPIKKMIPIYLVVAGGVGITSKLLPFVNRKLNVPPLTYFIYTVYMFEVVWMILGSYWVYIIHKPNFDKRMSLYCDKTTYDFAFWLLSVSWAFILIIIVLVCCATCCIVLLDKKISE